MLKVPNNSCGSHAGLGEWVIEALSWARTQIMDYETGRSDQEYFLRLTLPQQKQANHAQAGS